MNRSWIGLITLLTLGVVVVTATASTPIFTEEVTDYGRNRWRTHYTPTEPQYPLGPDVRAAWEVPLGLSRSQPLVIRRDLDGDGRPEVRIYHLAGDRLWALDGELTPSARRSGQTAHAYRAQLRDEDFIRWDLPAEQLCQSLSLRDRDPLLALKCDLLGPRPEARPFASSQATYLKGPTPQDDVIYAGFGHPAAVMAIRAVDGALLGGYIIDPLGDRGIVAAPLAFAGDTVVVGTTAGEAYLIRGLAAGTPQVRGLKVGGRISFSPLPLGESGFLIAADARQDLIWGSHGYLMAYGLRTPGQKEFTPRWPAAVLTPAGIPGEGAIDGETLYLADKNGRLYALRLATGELLWCRQYPALSPCEGDGEAQPGFINNGPGIDEHRVYFVFRNSEGPNQGGGQVVALDKGTGQVLWRQSLAFKGNTAPVPMDEVLLVGDSGGFVRAFDKGTGLPVTWGGYPLRLTDEPYQEGSQGERWWEPIGGTATQMTVAQGLLLVGVNSATEERTLLKAYRLFPLPDLVLETLEVPPTADSQGFTARVRAACRFCEAPVQTVVSLSIGGFELPRVPVSFRPEQPQVVTLTWESGPVPAGARLTLVATIDPANKIEERNEANNSLRANVVIVAPVDGGEGERWGSRLID